MTSLQRRTTSLSVVALTSLHSCYGNVRQRCKNEVVTTSHYDLSLRDVATTSFLQRRPTFPWQLCGDVRATSVSDVARTLQQRLCFCWELPSRHKDLAIRQSITKVSLWEKIISNIHILHDCPKNSDLLLVFDNQFKSKPWYVRKSYFLSLANRLRQRLNFNSKSNCCGKPLLSETKQSNYFNIA